MRAYPVIFDKVGAYLVKSRFKKRGDVKIRLPKQITNIGGIFGVHLQVQMATTAEAPGDLGSSNANYLFHYRSPSWVLATAQLCRTPERTSPTISDSITYLPVPHGESQIAQAKEISLINTFDSL